MLPACLPASEDPLAILKDDEEKEHDSDEEWRAIRERAAARHVVKTAPKVGAWEQAALRLLLAVAAVQRMCVASLPVLLPTAAFRP